MSIPELHKNDVKPIPMSHTNRWDVIGTLVFSILFVPAIGLATHYALTSTGPIVQLSSHFSMNVPLLICSSFEITSFIILTIQLVRKDEVKKAFSRSITNSIISSSYLQSCVRSLLYYGKAKKTSCSSNKNYAPVEFRTQDNVILKGYWNFKGAFTSTVVFFHGNNQTAKNAMESSWGHFYSDLGYNVLFVEYRGYSESQGQAATEECEMQANFDAEAAMNFVRPKVDPHAKIIAHGYSLGGAYAASAGRFFGADAVILDHSFTSLSRVISTLLPIVESDAQQIVAAAFPSHTADSSLNICPLETDGFNTLEKIKKCPKVLVIQGKNDKLMAPDIWINAKSQVNFEYCVVQGGHNDNDPNDASTDIQNFCNNA